ncbi:MAG: hypothetical protein RIS47_2263, partial [Bacteroidota bacterium]
MDKVFLNRILVGLFCKIADVMSHFGREQFLGNGRILRVVLLFVGFGFVSTNIFAQPLQASFSASKIFNVSCFGGKDGAAEVSVVGGLPPYSYFWDIQAKFQTTRRAVNLTAGTYEVWVTDATSTSVKAQVLVSQSPRLSVNVDGSSIVNVLCQGNFSGSAIAVADGGTPPYNYVWSDGQFGATASKLKAGYYSVYVTDALGC